MPEHIARAPKAAAAWPGFERWQAYLSLGDYGIGLPAFERLKQALRDVREFRYASNYRGGDYETEQLAVRVVSDALAGQIQASASDNQDADTIAWVIAGLRCKRRPFCQGCRSCQTVTSPLRPVKASR